MKNLVKFLDYLVVKGRKVKQKVKKLKFREDGKLKKQIEREIEYETSMPSENETVGNS